MTHNVARQYIQLTMKNLVGIDARSGRVLWKSSWPGKTAVVPTPVFSKGNVYVSSGYGVGCKMVNVGAENRLRDIWQNKVMKNHHGGVILYGQHLYGFSDGSGLICQELASGREIWQGDRRTLAKGTLTIADDMIICMNESNGDVVLAPATPNGFREAGRFRLEPQSRIRSRSGKIWTHPVVSNGKLYLRDQEYIYCHIVGSGNDAAAVAPSPAVPPGKKFVWTASVNQQSIDVVYRNQPEAVVRRAFGKPDKTQGVWLGYSGLNITDIKGNKYGTAWFGFANGVVQQVRFDK